MNRSQKQYEWYKSLFKINYDTIYRNYKIIDKPTNDKYVTGVIFRYTGDVYYDPIGTFLHKKKRKIIFNNKGNVIAHAYKQTRFLFFDNDGDVTLYLHGKPACTLLFLNSGNVTITGGDISNNEMVGNTFFCNNGDVHIYKINRICNYTNIYNAGNFSIDSVYLLSKGLKVSNLGNVHINNVSVVEKEIIFRNDGDITIDSNKNIFFNEKIIFSNKGNVFININQYTYVFEDVLFENNGNVYINNKLPILCSIKSTFKNKGNIYFSDNILGLRASQAFLFYNYGNVDMSSILSISGGARFENTGSVYSQNLKTIESPTLVIFNNGKDVDISNLEKTEKFISTPKIFSGGNVIVKNEEFLSELKRVVPIGYIKSQGTSYYSNETYLKRYKIPVNNGKVILYKAVDKKKRTAPYDKEDNIQWIIGETIEHKEWDPYENEIGKGKFVASINPNSFHAITKIKNISFLAIEIDVLDLYEYPFGKYPQFIGFRKGKVLYEVDKQKNILPMKYQFAKDFYDYMEKNGNKNKPVMVKITNKVRTNKFYYDENGEKKKNPYNEKLYKKMEVIYLYGVDYYEERKKIEPDWVPDTKRGTYHLMPDNPLLKVSDGTGNASIGIVNMKKYKTSYYVLDNNTLVPWNEVETDDVKMYMPEYNYIDKDKPAITINKFLADSIYSISHVQLVGEEHEDIKDNQYEIVKEFVNDDYIYGKYENK